MLIKYDDYDKLDIRIGAILSVERVEKSDKLLKIIVDLGSEKRQILSGLAQYYEDYSNLIGLQVPVLVNLEPKKMFGFESHGMILMADVDDYPIQITPLKKVKNGTVVR